MNKKPVNFIDLTGKSFGRWTVINFDEESKKWLCKCTCGTMKLVNGSSLRGGKSKSCGCLSIELMQKRTFVNYSGKRLGKLTVKEFVGYKNGHSEFKCKCDCGSEIIVGVGQIIRGIQSCGCMQSSGEYKIAELLSNSQILFKREKTFNTCRYKDTGRKARFDFYINTKYLIEYDGPQHFEYRPYLHSSESAFIKGQERDFFKTNWCKENNIPLIRIPYTHLDDLCIDDLRLETTKFRVC